MNIWFYLFLIVLCIAIFLILKVLIMKQEIKNIGESLADILKSDTNNLITINTNDNVWRINTIYAIVSEVFTYKCYNGSESL